tara:strand:- start:8 stop:244 length:237 start_codon:yes stop_codon:yes gene_type:complete
MLVEAEVVPDGVVPRSLGSAVDWTISIVTASALLDVIDWTERVSPEAVDTGIGVSSVILDGRTGADEYDVPEDSDTVI